MTFSSTSSSCIGCQSACRPSWHFHPSQAHPSNKPIRKLCKKLCHFAYWKALDHPATQSEWLKHPWLKTKIGFHDVSRLGGCLEVFVVPARVRFWIVFTQIQESVKWNFPPSKPPSVSVSGKSLGVLPKEEKTQPGSKAKLICAFKRTSFKKPSVLKKLPAHVNVSVLWGTVHLKVWRAFSRDRDSASHFETKTMYFGYSIVCVSRTKNYSQWYLNNVLRDRLWAKTSSTRKNGARQDVSFNCVAHLQDNTADVCHKMFRNGFSFVQPKESKGQNMFPAWNSPHGVVCSRSSWADTKYGHVLGGDNFQSFFHTSTRNVVNEVFHGQNALIRPGNHNNTLWRTRQLQIVASFVNGKTTWWNLLLQAQKERPSSTMLNPFFPLPPRHRQKAQGFGILIFSQVKKWYLSSDVWVDIFKKMLTVGTKLLVIFRAPRELYEDFHAWSIFVLPSLITNNPPSKTSAKSTCLWTW